MGSTVPSLLIGLIVEGVPVVSTTLVLELCVGDAESVPATVGLNDIGNDVPATGLSVVGGLVGA